MAIAKKNIDWEKFPYIPLALLLLVIYYFGRNIIAKLREWLNPDNYNTNFTVPIEQKTKALYANKWIKDGYFVYGSGKVSRWTVGNARNYAEQLAATLKTGKDNHWLSTLVTFTWTSVIPTLNTLLNPMYPAVMRKFIVECYRDIYTDKRALMNDVKSATSGFAGTNKWTKAFTDFFNY